MDKMTSTKSILLADDDIDDAEIFADLLSEIDPLVEFYHAKDGLGVFEHISQMGEDTPNIILLDLNMPEMNGWQCLSRLKKDPLTKDIPVLIYSTSSYHRDKQTAIEFGASAFITKPSDYHNLRKLISAVTSQLNSNDIGVTIRDLM
jgi:CheY-like chemotaxis protein